MSMEDMVAPANLEEFRLALADAIHASVGGDEDEDTPTLSVQEALPHADHVWAELKRTWEDEYPCMTRHLGLQFVYQWDEDPPLVTVMFWNGKMWQDTRRIVVPEGA